ncbi:uncharacterized protein LOC126739932 [Anthonomus grandis grandis]|uniref:uncharacterized protein LOC126739932 n=1 Tax=Anthonomus grandis grandis TaxID=2921223 RepID=UPI002164FBF3|nr:uncharacterized protein LOC126739932 [Anthonomus grandis grandis]
MAEGQLMDTKNVHFSSNHHFSHRNEKLRPLSLRNDKLMWVLICLVSVLPVVLLLLKLCRKASERYESRRQREQPSSNHLTDSFHRQSNSSVYTITKQDYSNMAPPRYSTISIYPVRSTYEKPPPYYS